MASKVMRVSDIRFWVEEFGKQLDVAIRAELLVMDASIVGRRINTLVRQKDNLERDIRLLTGPDEIRQFALTLTELTGA